MTILLYIFSRKIYPVQYEYGKIFTILVMIISSGAVYYYLLYNDQLTFFLKVILLLGFVSLLFILKVVKIEEVRTTYKILLRKK
jgi:hypothetical protein